MKEKRLSITKKKGLSTIPMRLHAIQWSIYNGITVGFGHAWLHGGSAAVG